MEPLLFAEDQETEECFSRLGTRDAITQRFQAEGGVPVTLDKPERRNFREKARGTFKLIHLALQLAAC